MTDQMHTHFDFVSKFKHRLGIRFPDAIIVAEQKNDDDNEKFYSARCNHQLDRRFETFKFNTSAGKKNIV